MAKTKEEVDEWIKRMDVSLVFVSGVVCSLIPISDQFLDRPILGGTYSFHCASHSEPCSQLNEYS